jgi:electron transport complex protein RnfE
MIIERIQPDKRPAAELLLIPPLLALSINLRMSLAAGLTFVILLLVIAVSVSLVRQFIAWQLRLPCLALIIATWISMLDMALLAEQYELRQQFGLYLPLLACNSLVFTLSEDTFLRRHIRVAISRAAGIGLLVLSLFLVTGIARELLAYGTAGADLQPDLATVLPIAATAPGALLCTGLVFAAWKFLADRRSSRPMAQGEGALRGE